MAAVRRLITSVTRNGQLRLLAKAALPSLSTARSYCSEKPPGRYPVPDMTSLPADIQERIDEVQEKSGFLPNVFKVYAHRPDEFRAFFAYYDALMLKEDNLSKADKELIVVATSAANNCLYCVVAHGALLRIFSKKPQLADQAAINWEAADLSAREQVMVAFALKVCHADPILEEDFEMLAEHGFSREDAWDIGSIAAFFAMSNRMAHVTDMRPNDEFHLMGRVTKEKDSSEGITPQRPL